MFLVTIIHNTKLNRWHPVFFTLRPLPGPPAEGKPDRYKSEGHHTEGFATREEAVDHAENDLKPSLKKKQAGTVRLFLDEDLTWDGEGIPAEVALFPAEKSGD